MIILKLLTACLAGFGAHQAYKPTLAFGPRWGNMLRYGIGALVMLPFVLLLQDEFDGAKPAERTLAGYVLSLLGVGAGVFLGHLADKS